MSFAAAAWAIKQKPKSAHEKLVLVILADCFNAENTRCDPSLSFLANTALCSEKTVRRAVASLEEQGYFITKKSHGRSTHYQLNFLKDETYRSYFSI